MQVYIEIKSTV